jgi:AcrR family transcriptional regulator
MPSPIGAAAAAPARGGTGRPGRPRRSSAERAAKRSQLLEAAKEAIRQLGPSLSINDMAEQAGVSKPVLHDEFGGKSGIAEAISLDLVSRAELQILQRLADVSEFDMRAYIRITIDAIVDAVADDPAVYSYLVRTLRADDRGLLDNALVTTMLERAQFARQLIAPRLDPDLFRVLAHGSFGFVFAAIESWQSSRTPSREVLLDSLVEVTTRITEALAASPLLAAD